MTNGEYWLLVGGMIICVVSMLVFIAAFAVSDGRRKRDNDGLLLGMVVSFFALVLLGVIFYYRS